MARSFPLWGLVLVAMAVALPLPVQGQGGVEGAQPVRKTTPPVTQPPSGPVTPPPPDSPTQIKVQSTLVTTPVTVINHAGDFVSDLDRPDFKILDNGVLQHIERFDLASDPIALVILVQTNDNVASLLGQVRPLGPIFSDLLLGPSGQAAVMTFSDRVQLVQDFTGDRDRMKAALLNLQGFGLKARMNDAIMQALALLEARPKSGPQTERRLIVVFSDGSDHGSENSQSDVVRRMTNDEVTLYGLHLSRVEALLRDQPDNGAPMNPLDASVTRPVAPGTVPTTTNASNTWGTPNIPGIPILTAAGETISSEFVKNTLQAYAGYSGGVYYSHWTKTALQDQLNRIASEVHSQYEIAYIPSTLSEVGFHRIEVRVAKPNLKLRARAGYFYEKR
ncbi:MAG TPA: VWA domain-containing protein [Terriglobia bacterium]